MKLRRPLQAVLIVAVLVATASAALAASVEIKVRTMLREKPTTSSRIVERLPAGKKVPMLGKTEDGNWVHVRAGGHEGWIQAAAVKGLRAEDEDAGEEASDDEPVRPLAKPRGVRPEAWVSKSRYHEGEELKLIVSVNEANLYGRPSATGAVLGILRRGEQVQIVKRSADKKWINIDIGGGETAWIQARAVKPGKVATSTPPPDESAQEEAAPPPTITPEGAKKKAKLAKAEEPPPEEEAPPPPPPKKQKKQAKVEPPPEEEAPPPKRKARDVENETPPGLAADGGQSAQQGDEGEKPKKKKRKQKKVASRSDESSESAEGTVVKDYWTSHGRVYLTPAVRAGIAILSQRFTSNGMGTLANYEGSTNAFGAQIGLGVTGTVGRYILLGGDASYMFAGAAALRYIQPTDGTAVTLGVQSHTIDGGVSAGIHFGVVGGLSVRLRLGGQMVLNLVQPDVRVKLPSDRILGMTIGLSLAAPALFTLAGRPFGISLFGGGLVPAQRAQTVGLEDGAQSTTFGAFFGGALSFVVMQPGQTKYKGQLAIEAAYAYEFVATHYTGLSRRNNTITLADRGSAQHLISLGLGFYY